MLGLSASWRKTAIWVGLSAVILVSVPYVAFLNGKSLTLDQAVTSGIHNLSTPGLTAFMKAVSLYAYHPIHWWIIGAVALYFLARRRSVWEPLALLAVRYGSDFAQETIKTWYARPRPVLDWVKPSSSFSYPSGTATVGAALVLALAYILAREIPSHAGKRMVIGSGWAVAALIALSRIYLGAHWLSDTVGAIALAAAIVAVAVQLVPVRTAVPVGQALQETAAAKQE